MKRIGVFLLLFIGLKSIGQTTGYLRFDTVRIMKQGGTCELYLINSTKDSLGALTNVGGGLTRFIKPKKLNDSTLVIGLDTISLAGNNQLFDLIDTRIAFGDSDNHITDDADLTYTASTNRFNTGTGNFADSLLVGRLRDGTTSDSVVVWDNITKALKKVVGGSFITASNGLTKTGNDIQLGGTLAQSTSIALAGFDLGLTGSGSFTFPNGSAATPILKFSGHNSGIYSSGTNQVSVSTGGVTSAIFFDQALQLGRWVNGAAINLLAAPASGGSNRTGMDLQIFGGPGTGNGVGGGMSFWICPPGSSGSFSNPAVSAMYIRASDGHVAIGTLVDGTSATHRLTIRGDMSILETPAGTGSDSVLVKGSDNKVYAIAQSDLSGGGGGVTGFTDGSGFDGTVTGSNLSLTTSLATGSIPFIGASGALSEDNANYFWDNSNKRLGIGTATPARPFHNLLADAATNSVTSMNRLTHTTSGTAAVGFGLNREIELENASGSNIIAATEVFAWSDATGPSEDATWTLNLIRGGSLAQAATINSAGQLTVANSLVAAGNATVGSANSYIFSGRSSLHSAVNGDITLFNNAQNGFGRLNFGGTSSSFPSLLRSSANLIARLADNSANTDIEVLDEAYDATGWNGSNEVPTKNAIRDMKEGMNIVQGTYTPTLTNGTNTAASSVPGTTLYYKREGNHVTVWGHVEVDPTAATTTTVLSISLPVPSALTNATQLSGQGAGNASAGHLSGYIAGDATDDRAQLEFTSSGTAAGVWSIRFTYEIL